MSGSLAPLLDNCLFWLILLSDSATTLQFPPLPRFSLTFNDHHSLRVNAYAISFFLGKILKITKCSQSLKITQNVGVSFWILSFSTFFFPITFDLSGNTDWLQASVFRFLWTSLAMLNETFSMIFRHRAKYSSFVVTLIMMMTMLKPRVFSHLQWDLRVLMFFFYSIW